MFYSHLTSGETEVLKLLLFKHSISSNLRATCKMTHQCLNFLLVFF